MLKMKGMQEPQDLGHIVHGGSVRAAWKRGGTFHPACHRLGFAASFVPSGDDAVTKALVDSSAP